jgi:hypothetical protein
VNWYGSFEFHYLEGCEPYVVLDEVGSDPLGLFRRIRDRGHVYKISPEEPLASLQIASETVEQEHEPAPLRFRVSDEMREEIGKLIGQHAKRLGRA